MSDKINLPETPLIPDELKPKKAEERVKAEVLVVDAREIGTDEAQRAASEFGAVLVKKNLLSDLRAIGIEIEKAGITQVANGGLVVFQGALVAALMEAQKLLAEAKTEPKKLRAISAINHLARTYGQTSMSASVAQMTKNETDKGKVKRASVPKGAIMSPMTITVLPQPNPVPSAAPESKAI